MHQVKKSEYQADFKTVKKKFKNNAPKKLLAVNSCTQRTVQFCQFQSLVHDARTRQLLLCFLNF